MLYVLLLSFCIYFAYFSIQSFRTNIREVTIRPTQLNILEVLNTNKFIVAQQGVDFFLNTNDYVAIVPYVVKAGFILDNHLQSFMKTEDDTLVIRLPKPEIIYVTESDTASEIPVKDGNPDIEFVKGMRIFGERYAKRVALKRNLLETANKRAVIVLKDMITTLGIADNVRVETTPPDSLNENTYDNDFLPISITLPNEFPCEIITANKNTTGISISPIMASKENFYIFPVDFVNTDNIIKMKSRIFDPIFPHKRFSLYFYDDNRVIYSLQFGRTLYYVYMEAESKQNRDLKLPDFLTFLYSIHDNENMNTDEIPCKSIYGFSKQDYLQMTIESLKPLSVGILFIESLINDNLYFFENNIPVLTDREGILSIHRDKRAFINDIYNTFAKLQFNDGIVKKDIAKWFNLPIDGHGVLITDVLKDFPGDKMGMQINDTIIEINGEKVTNTSVFSSLIYKYFVKDSTMYFKVIRKSNVLNKSIEINEQLLIELDRLSKDLQQQGNVFRSIKMGMECSNLINFKLNISIEDVLGLVYNYNEFQRNRYIFLLQQGIIFYVHSNLFQNEQKSFILYDDFYDINKVNFKNNELYFDNIKIESKSIQEFLQRSLKFGIIGIYNPNCN